MLSFAYSNRILVILGIIMLLCFIFYITSHFTHHFNENIILNESLPTRVLIVYVYANTHAFAKQNLEFFIRTAVNQSYDADYYFVFQQLDGTSFNESHLPLLPSNAHYVQHENKCFDIGTIAWFLSSGRIDKTKYKYFIFLNSSVRGPFIVSYYDNSIWYTIFTRRLNNHIRLVGSTINCEISPHVQSYLWTLDLDGLNFLLKTDKVFTCYRTKEETILNAEVGASQTFLRSGFGIDSLMKKYQGINFLLDVNKVCNNRENPTFSKTVDGITLDPFEVVFVKVKNEANLKVNRQRTEVYEKWIL